MNVIPDEALESATIYLEKDVRTMKNCHAELRIYIDKILEYQIFLPERSILARWRGIP